MRVATSVYFIQAGGDGPIKIGVARDPRRRMGGFQIAHPARLRLLATTPGGYDLEREMHRRFAEHRVGGEWFKPDPSLLAHIEGLVAAPAPEQAAVDDHAWLFDFVSHNPAKQEWMRVPMACEVRGRRHDVATDGVRLVAVEGAWFPFGGGSETMRRYCTSILRAKDRPCDLAALRAFVNSAPANEEGDRPGRILGADFNLDLLAPLLAPFEAEPARIVPATPDTPMVIRADGILVALSPLRLDYEPAVVFQAAA